MDAQIDEIGDGIFRFSLYVPEIAPPAGFTFNHFLIKGDEPLLFHCGKRKMFASLAPAVAKVMPLDELRWIAFGHFEADECGAMNEWLAAAPRAELAHGMLACRLSVADMADRPPRMLTDGEVVDIGGRRVRYIDTPHVPHGWDAGVIFEETTRTLFAGDLFAHYGRGPALTRSRDCRTSDRVRRHQYGDRAGANNGTDHPPFGKPRAGHARRHARFLVRGRWRSAIARARRLL